MYYLHSPRRNTIVFFLIAMLGCCFGCSNDNKHASHQSVGKQMTFLDSVSAQKDLSLAQIKRHTIIGPAYFKYASDDSTKHSPSFQGDTIYYAKSDHPLAVVTYNDTLGVCLRKILLVYDAHTLKNIAYYQVEEDWDIDYSSNDTQAKFEVVNNNLFYVDHILTERKGREHVKTDKQTISRQYFKINTKGKIEPSPPKVISVKQVEKDEDEL